MDFTKVTNFLNSLSDAGIPGSDLAIYIKGKEVYRHQTGYTNLETKDLIKPDTLYAFYSMTKVITCVAAMQLNEKGLFNLNDPVSDYLPEFKDMTVKHVRDNGAVEILPAVNQMRIVDCFTMSTGLTYNFSEGLEKLVKKTKDSFSNEEFISVLAKDPLYFEPGTHWHYSFSHDVLARVIEVISGKSLGEYFNDHIFKPLGMKDTFFKLPENKAKRMGLCYTYDEKTKKHNQINHFINFTPGSKYESGGGGLISSVDDYAKFANALCKIAGWGDAEPEKYGKDHIISKASINLMRTNHLCETRMNDYNWGHHSGYGYGLGVRTMVDKSTGGSNSNIGEFGWSGAAGTFLLIDPSIDLAYVYAQQLLPSKEEYVAPRLRNVIYGCL